MKHVNAFILLCAFLVTSNLAAIVKQNPFNKKEYKYNELIIHEGVQTKNRQTAKLYPTRCRTNLTMVLQGLIDAIRNDGKESYYEICFNEFLNEAETNPHSNINMEIQKLQKKLPNLRTVILNLATYFTEKNPFDWGKYPLYFLHENVGPEVPASNQPVCIGIEAHGDYIQDIFQHFRALKGTLKTAAGYELIPGVHREKAVKEWETRTLGSTQAYFGITRYSDDESPEVKLIKNRFGLRCTRKENPRDRQASSKKK